jgi:hypothetical protein
MKAMADLLEAGAETIENGLHPPRLTSETIVGGIYEIVYSRVLQGKTAQLPSLLPDLAYSMMLPYVGHVEAEKIVAELRATNPPIVGLEGEGDEPSPPLSLASDG